MRMVSSVGGGLGISERKIISVGRGSASKGSFCSSMHVIYWLRLYFFEGYIIQILFLFPWLIRRVLVTGSLVEAVRSLLFKGFFGSFF